MNILEEFWYGNVRPNEKGFKRRTEYEKLLNLIARNEEKLTALLNDSGKETFAKYRECMDEFTGISECQIFVEGFRLGARFAIECMNENGGIFEELT